MHLWSVKKNETGEFEYRGNWSDATQRKLIPQAVSTTGSISASLAGNTITITGVDAGYGLLTVEYIDPVTSELVSQVYQIGVTLAGDIYYPPPAFQGPVLVPVDV